MNKIGNAIYVMDMSGNNKIVTLDEIEIIGKTVNTANLEAFEINKNN